MSVSTHLVWLPRWSSTIQLYSRDTKILISKILFLCNMFTVLSSWQLLCDFSKQIKWINWNTMASPLFLCSKKDIFLQSFPVYWENLSYLLLIFYSYPGIFFECVHQHLATLEDISMSCLVTKAIPLWHKFTDRSV